MTPDIPTPAVEREYFFGPFHFIPGQQLLLCEDAPLRIGGRALAILEVLVEQPGEVVGKQALFARVWPRTVVEESNLKVHIAALRRALSDGGRESQYIATVSGRGYRFVAPVRIVEGSAVQTAVVAPGSVETSPAIETLSLPVAPPAPKRRPRKEEQE